jgi:methyl-accepting chemotaxis protein
MDTTNPEIVKLAKELRPIHMALHKHVAEIKEQMAETNAIQAQDIALNELYPLSEQVFEFVSKMKAISDVAYKSWLMLDSGVLM